MDMKSRMALDRTPMPTRLPQERIKSFEEVALGYTKEDAVREAQRCIQCKTRPCVKGCPVGIQIPEFIAAIEQEDFQKAYEILSKDTVIPAVCGRVCPQESQCEGVCTRGVKGESVAIGRLERFVADWYMQQSCDYKQPVPSNGKQVAVIGSGPSGLACAGELCQRGYQVTVFEALHLAGGVLVYGIPEFRLPKNIVQREIEVLEGMGVIIKLNQVIGRTHTIKQLFEEGFDAVYIASGAGLPKFMCIPGEMLSGVYSANEYLTRINLMKAGQPGSHTPILRGDHVVVVGGGNVAMDAARCARRMGSEVTIVYRRSMEELPARREEVEHAMEEGIIFQLLHNPTQILGDEKGNVVGMEVIEMTLGEPDASGRRRPIEKKGSEKTLSCDLVIMALGTSPNPLIKMTTPGLETERWGGIITNGEDGLTSVPNVYAGGDAVTGAATVILAMGAGKSAAKAIDKALQG